MKNNLGIMVKNFLGITLGNFLYTAAVVFFILPIGLMTGGAAGLGIFLQGTLGIPITVFTYIFNIVMFILGAWVMGKRFALTTLLSTIEYPVFLSILTEISKITGPLTNDRLLATVLAGIVIGIGLGIVFDCGASTGGMDIPPLILQKLTGMNLSIALYLFDIVILILQIFVVDHSMILYGILLVFLYTAVMNSVMTRGKRQMQLQIISPHYEEINKVITSEIDRGSTLIEVIGGYSGKPSMAVLTVVSPRELFRLQQLVQNIDPSAFITISEVREVKGRGFSMRKFYPETPAKAPEK